MRRVSDSSLAKYELYTDNHFVLPRQEGVGSSIFTVKLIIEELEFSHHATTIAGSCKLIVLYQGYVPLIKLRRTLYRTTQYRCRRHTIAVAWQVSPRDTHGWASRMAKRRGLNISWSYRFDSLWGTFAILSFPFSLVAYHPSAHVQEHEHVQRIVFRGKLTKRNLLHLGITFAEDGSRQGKIVANWPLLWTTPIRNTTKLWRHERIIGRGKGNIRANATPR